MYPLAPFTSPCHMRMIHKTIATTGQRNNNKNVSRTAQVSYTCQIITVDMWIDYGERLCDVRSNSVFRYFIFVFLVLCYTLVKLHKSYVFMGQAQCFASSLTLTLCGVDCEWYYTVGHSRTQSDSLLLCNIVRVHTQRRNRITHNWIFTQSTFRHGNHSRLGKLCRSSILANHIIISTELAWQKVDSLRQCKKNNQKSRLCRIWRATLMTYSAESVQWKFLSKKKNKKAEWHFVRGTR